jgi:hypothetical protein
LRSKFVSWGVTPAPQAVQMATVNGCLVGRRADVICATDDFDVHRVAHPRAVVATESASSPVLKMVIIKTIPTLPCTVRIVENEYHCRCTIGDVFGVSSEPTGFLKPS